MSSFFYFFFTAVLCFFSRAWGDKDAKSNIDMFEVRHVEDGEFSGCWRGGLPHCSFAGCVSLSLFIQKATGWVGNAWRDPLDGERRFDQCHGVALKSSHVAWCSYFARGAAYAGSPRRVLLCAARLLACRAASRASPPIIPSDGYSAAAWLLLGKIGEKKTQGCIVARILDDYRRTIREAASRALSMALHHGPERSRFGPATRGRLATRHAKSTEIGKPTWHEDA